MGVCVCLFEVQYKGGEHDCCNVGVAWGGMYGVNKTQRLTVAVSPTLAPRVEGLTEDVTTVLVAVGPWLLPARLGASA